MKDDEGRKEDGGRNEDEGKKEGCDSESSSLPFNLQGSSGEEK